MNKAITWVENHTEFGKQMSISEMETDRLIEAINWIKDRKFKIKEAIGESNYSRGFAGTLWHMIDLTPLYNTLTLEALLRLANRRNLRKETTK